jgi:hypothetical protein
MGDESFMLEDGADYCMEECDGYCDECERKENGECDGL